MATIAIAIGTLVLVIAGWRTLTSPRPRGWALAAAVATSTFVPLYGAPREWVLTSSLGMMVLLLIATVRTPRVQPNQLTWVIPAVVGLVVITRLSGLFSIGYSPTDTLTGIVMVGVLLVGRHIDDEDIATLGKVLSVVMIFHAAWAAGELFAGMDPLFPMGDGSVEITDRPNAIFPQIAGRPITSFAHPIPLATFSAFVGLLTLYLARTRKHILYWVVTVVAVATTTISGTRSAVLGLVAAGIILVVSTSKIPLFLRGLLTVIALGGASISVVDAKLLSAIGLGSDFLDSGSYLHRSAVLNSFWHLFDRNTEEILFGSGTNRELIFQTGLVHGYLPGAYFFDNQYVAAFAMYGLVAFILFVALSVYVLVRGQGLERAVGLSLIAMGFSFDFLLYFTASITWVLMIAATVAMRNAHTTDSDPTQRPRRDDKRARRQVQAYASRISNPQSTNGQTLLRDTETPNGR
ncbi:MAG: O-antigen ligase family protein [Microbacterium sp.]